LKCGIIHFGGALLLRGFQLALVLVPEVLVLVGVLGIHLGLGGVSVQHIGDGVCGSRIRSSFHRGVGGILGQAAQGLHVAAVEVQHVRLEAGDFQANPLILPLLHHPLVTGLADDLVGAVGGLLQQVIGITYDVVAADVGLVDDLLRLLVGLADDVFADPLGIDEGGLHDLTVGAVILGLLGQALVFALQLLNLLLQTLQLIGV